MTPNSRTTAVFITAALLALGNAAPSPQADAGALQYKGCYSSSNGMSDQGSYTWQSNGYCQKQCSGQNQAVMGLSGGSDCYCGGELPPSSALVSDSKCSMTCNGYPDNICGGSGFYSVYLTGISDDVPTAGGSSSSSSSNSNGGSSDSSNSDASTTAAAVTTKPAAATAAPNPTTTQAPSIITSVAPGKTVVITQPAAAENTAPVSTTTPTPEASEKKKGGSNVAGIAAGVVVGVVAIAAIAGGLFLFFRHRRRQQQEEEYKKTQVSDFMGAGNASGMTYEHKSPGTAGGWSTLSDSRLDPELANGRRNSVGSIADDQDYSRRILRVANPS